MSLRAQAAEIVTWFRHFMTAVVPKPLPETSKTHQIHEFFMP